MGKNSVGNFFEDFRPGQILSHATPKTITDGDVSLYTGLYGRPICSPIFTCVCQDDRLCHGSGG